jgi:stage II sporulation protein D
MNHGRILTFLVLLVGSITTDSSIAKIRYYGQDPKLNVLIGRNLSDVSIKGLDLKSTLHLKKKSLDGKRSVQFNCANQNTNEKTNLDKSKAPPVLLASISSPAGILSFGNDQYRGDIDIVATPGHQSCDVINRISMEDYISSLLNKEMRHDWPIEALKAQAVAARTYAFFMKKDQRVNKEFGGERFYDIESSEKHQVYGNFSDQTKSTTKAAIGTKGEILITGQKSNEEVTPIFFHSKCGGGTRRPDQVWSNPVDGYTRVECPYCHLHGQKEWTTKLSFQGMRELLQKYLADELKYTAKKVEQSFKGVMMLAPDNPTQAFLRVYNGDELIVVKKAFLRRHLGRKEMPSNNFQLTKTSTGFVIRGNGNGHGVGLCQYGALEMAQKGLSYQEILAHYFPQHRITKLY